VAQLAKSNPGKAFKVQEYLRANPKESRWTVLRQTKIFDTLFIGQSGNEAGIYAVATVTSEPAYGPEEPDEFWNDPEQAKKPRWRANVRFNKNLVRSLILEDVLRKDLRLLRVADWLHRQGAVLKLSQEEHVALNEALDARV